jgi:hypothetical protein
VLPGATSGDQERGAVDGGQQEPGEAAGDEGGPASPCQQDPQARCGLDVAHAHPGRADQREQQAEAGQGDAAQDSLGQDMPVPPNRGRREQEQRGAAKRRAGQHVWQPPHRGVDERERDGTKGEPAGSGQDQAGMNPRHASRGQRHAAPARPARLLAGKLGAAARRDRVRTAIVILR